MLHLPFRILEKIGFVSLGNAHRTTCKTSSMFSSFNTMSSSFYSHQRNLFILKKRQEDTAGVGTAANTGINPVWKSASLFLHLGF